MSKEDKGKVKKKNHKGFFTAWEDEVIRTEWQTTTDKDLAAKLGRPVEGISRRRKILGLTKREGRPKLAAKRAAIIANPTEYNLSKLNKDDRLQFYRTQFDKNPRYPWLVRMLMDDEIEYYKAKYIETIDSLDSITHTEEDLLHNMIMKEIHIIRLQEQIKMAIERHNDDDEENKGIPPQMLYKDLGEAEKQYVNYQEKLRITREQRLKTDKEEKVTIASLVRSFLDIKNRHKAGQIAGELEYFADRCEEDMTKMGFLLGADLEENAKKKKRRQKRGQKEKEDGDDTEGVQVS